MPDQLEWRVKSLPTCVAFEFPGFFLMDLTFVFVETTDSFEGSITTVALKRAFTGVSSFVLA